MEKIYRVRPINDTTVDELINHYLWFSKPSGFKDVNDANICAFIDNNDIVMDALKQVFSEKQIEELKVKMRDIGICCFTETMPNKGLLKEFPSGQNSICVEYDKSLLERHFRRESKYLIPKGFKKVIYFSNGAELKKCDESHYLEKCGEGFYTYASIKEITQHPRYLDEFFFTLLSTISSEFEKQKEQRLILGGINFNNLDLSGTGYKIEIPRNAICSIYTYGNKDKSFIEKLKATGLPINE